MKSSGNDSVIPNQTPKSGEITMEVIQRLFGRLAIIYSYRWTAMFPVADESVLRATLELWLEGLGDLKRIDLKRGLDLCARTIDNFVPSLAEFRDRCLPSIEELGIPDLDDAWGLAAKGELSHPIVWHVAMKTGAYEIKNRAEKEMKPIFAKHYVEIVNQARMGMKFTIPSCPTLPKPDDILFIKASEETAVNALQKMRAMLGKSKSK
jgi:hypothetical protein